MKFRLKKILILLMNNRIVFLKDFFGIYVIILIIGFMYMVLGIIYCSRIL